MYIRVEEMRSKVRRMEDFSFTASTGVKVTMDLSLLRSMSEEERSAARRGFDDLVAQLRIKYARQAAQI